MSWKSLLGPILIFGGLLLIAEGLEETRSLSAGSSQKRALTPLEKELEELEQQLQEVENE